MKAVKKCETAVSLDGPEVCREYLCTGKITFGSSALLPGQTGGIDPGHPGLTRGVLCKQGAYYHAESAKRRIF